MYWIIGVIGVLVYLFYRSKKKPQQNAEHQLTTIFPKAEVMDRQKQPEAFNNKINIFTKKGLSLCNEFVVIDFETTGLNCNNGKIIEIAAIKYKNREEIDTFTTLVNPGIPIPSAATRVNHITNQMVRSAPRIEESLPELLKFIGDSIIVAHNASFDLRFLKWNANQLSVEINNPVIDTLSISRKMFPELDNHKLGTVAQHLGIRIDNAHRALDDTRATGQILIHCLSALGNDDLREKSSTPEILMNSDKYQLIVEERTAAFEIVKMLLLKNEKPCSELYCRDTKSYLIIEHTNTKWFLRIKLDGKKKFVATDLPPEVTQEWAGDYPVEGNTTAGRSRVLISSLDDLEKLERLVVACYENLGLSNKEYQIS
jgi:DNA polymerase-3 subunit epsilon